MTISLEDRIVVLEEMIVVLTERLSKVENKTMHAGPVSTLGKSFNRVLQVIEDATKDDEPCPEQVIHKVPPKHNPPFDDPDWTLFSHVWKHTSGASVWQSFVFEAERRVNMWFARCCPGSDKLGPFVDVSDAMDVALGVKLGEGEDR